MNNNSNNMTEVIVFSATVEDRWFVWLIFLGCAVVAYVKVTEFFSVTYHAEDTVKTMAYVLLVIELVHYYNKKALTQKFYISNLGVKVKNGISGKWYTLLFQDITLVAVYKSKGAGVKVFSHNGEMIDTGIYAHSSIQKAVQLFEEREIRVCNSIEEVEKIVSTSEIVDDELVLVNNSKYKHLHYIAAFLPLILSVLLFSGIFVNSKCGEGEKVTVYGTLLTREIEFEKYGNKIRGRALIKMKDGTEEWFSLNNESILKVYNSQDVKITYERGMLGLGYDIKIQRR